jgi:hypothetical protein
MHHTAKVSEQNNLVGIIDGSARSTDLKGRENSNSSKEGFTLISS